MLDPEMPSMEVISSGDKMIQIARNRACGRIGSDLTLRPALQTFCLYTLSKRGTDFCRW
jgi:hypothetical protein